MGQTAKVIQLNTRRRPGRVDETMQTEPVSGGYLKLYRSLQEVSFASRPTHLAAWVHMLLLATHKPRKTMLGNSTVALQAGQFVSGRKALAERVGVSEKQMRGILGFFEKEGMITRASNRAGTVFTVVNYTRFNPLPGQAGPTLKGQPMGQPQPSHDGGCGDVGAKPGASQGPQNRATTQEHKTKRDTDVSLERTGGETGESASAKSASGFVYPDEFEWIWQNRPRREGSDPKRKAFLACNARLRQGARWRTLAEGMKRYHAYCATKGNLNTAYVMQAATFFGPDEHFNNDWKVNHEQPAPTSGSAAGGGKRSTVDRQHAAASAYLAGLRGESRGEDCDDTVVASYE